jgi:DNA-binding transcriptional regulator YiaG
MTGLASSRHNLANSSRAISRAIHHDPQSGCMHATCKSCRDHRPWRPEVALRPPRWMASLAQHERAARIASHHRSLATRIRRDVVHPARNLSAMGQRATSRCRRRTAACPRRGRSSPTPARATAARPTGEGIPRPHPHVTGRCPDRQTCGAFLREVCVWSAQAAGYARAATGQFIASHYRRFSGQTICPAPLPTVPPEYLRQLRALRRRLRLTQGSLAQRIGAAGKAVIYQWESRKRTPSPVLWQRVLRLEHRDASASRSTRQGTARTSADASSSRSHGAADCTL